MPISLARQEEFAVLTIDRPEAHNALSFLLIRELDECLDEVFKSDARALLIRGTGTKAFSAGADVAELAGLPATAHRANIEFGQRVFSRIETLPMISIALINGYAFGGGLELALSCTFRLASTTAKMGLPEVKLGLIPGYGGTQRLPRVIGETRALELILSGKIMGAQEAFQAGLVSSLVEGDLVEAGISYARQFTQHSLETLRLARSAVCRALVSPLNEGLKVEADLSTVACRTADAAEGIQAFLQKRPPSFQDS